MSKISLKAARVNAGFRQDDVGKRIGVSRQTVIRWEGGKCEISAQDFLKLCSLYGMSPDDIFLPTRST